MHSTCSYKHAMTRIIFIISGLLVAGCDVQYGVYRKADINNFIHHKCVELSLESVHELTDIKYSFLYGDPSFTSTTKEGHAMHRYHYTFEDINGFVSVLTNINRTQITQFSSANRKPPPQINIDRIRPIMDKIEIEISNHCEINNFSTLVEETCKKVECKQQ